MIDDPPLITLRRKVPRPTGAQLAELNGTPTGFIIDALGGRGAVAPDIKPVITEQASFCGVAVTCPRGLCSPSLASGRRRDRCSR
jgi:4-hydroxy-4-methyl-2-oxoglutarate aldolase